MSAIATDGREHFIYRVYDGIGDLLYIGCTVNPELRISWHRSRSAWFSEAGRIEWLPVGLIRRDALEIEATAIAVECPRENKAFNRGRTARITIDSAEPYGPMVCRCDMPDVVPSRDYGMCQVCKRKPLALMKAAS